MPTGRGNIILDLLVFRNHHKLFNHIRLYKKVQNNHYPDIQINLENWIREKNVDFQFYNITLDEVLLKQLE